MAAIELLATGSTAADSTELTVSAGAPVTVSLKGYTDSQVRVSISLKDDGNAFNVVGYLDSSAAIRGAACISAPGVYKFSRTAGQTCGVFSA
jgi:hypothetical protein